MKTNWTKVWTPRTLIQIWSDTRCSRRVSIYCLALNTRRWILSNLGRRQSERGKLAVELLVNGPQLKIFLRVWLQVSKCKLPIFIWQHSSLTCLRGLFVAFDSILSCLFQVSGFSWRQQLLLHVNNHNRDMSNEGWNRLSLVFMLVIMNWLIHTVSSISWSILKKKI